MMNKSKASKLPEEYKGSKEEAGHKGTDLGGTSSMGVMNRAIITAY